jgi:hypothetical protein
MKILHVRITDWDLEMITNGGQIDRIIDNVFLKVYRSNHKEKLKHSVEE